MASLFSLSPFLGDYKDGSSLYAPGTWAGNLQMDKVNYSHVVLIPKKTALEYIRDYRPIYLLNESIKIIVKILATRLSLVLPQMIGDYQTGFIQGSYILDGVALAQKIIHYCNLKKVKGFLLKLDFEKAFCSVNWRCLLQTLKYRGFVENWIDWIKIWLASAKVSILTNRIKGKDIVRRQGLRQGIHPLCSSSQWF